MVPSPIAPAAALREGIRRVNSAPVLLFAVFLATLLMAAPSTRVLRSMLRSHLDASLAADQAAAGVNFDWWQEFSGQATGVGTTFVPTIMGFSGVLRNLSDFIDNASLNVALVGVVGGYLIVWGFLAGGILDRLARNRRMHAVAFFSACGLFFARFLRLGLMAGLGYYLLFAWVHPFFFRFLFGRLTGDITAERTAFLIRLVFYALFGVLLLGWNLVLDYAKVRTVVEDRLSMFGALLASMRFLRRRLAGVIALYVIAALGFLVILAVYSLVPPLGSQNGLTVLLIFLVSQIYVIARLWLKLLFYASETVFFQGSLAHATFTASPDPRRWRDSPAAESVVNAVSSRT